MLTSSKTIIEEEKEKLKKYFMQVSPTGRDLVYYGKGSRAVTWPRSVVCVGGKTKIDGISSRNLVLAALCREICDGQFEKYLSWKLFFYIPYRSLDARAIRPVITPSNGRKAHRSDSFFFFFFPPAFFFHFVSSSPSDRQSTRSKENWFP